MHDETLPPVGGATPGLPLVQPAVAAVTPGGPAEPLGQVAGPGAVAAAVDAATVVRRDDLSRRSGQVAWLCVLLSGAALVAYLVTTWSVLVPTVAVLSATSVVAAVVRSRLDGARVPRLDD